VPNVAKTERPHPEDEVGRGEQGGAWEAAKKGKDKNGVQNFSERGIGGRC